MKAKIIGFRVSNFDTRNPEIGSPTSDANGITRRIEPSSASFRLSASLIVGILEVQVEKPNPERKKNVLRAIRCLVLMSTLDF